MVLGGKIYEVIVLEYFGCRRIAECCLGIVGQFDRPLEDQQCLSLCCEPRNKVPSISFEKTPEKTLENFLGMRHRLIVRGGGATNFN